MRYVLTHPHGGVELCRLGQLVLQVCRPSAYIVQLLFSPCSGVLQAQPVKTLFKKDTLDSAYATAVRTHGTHEQ